MIKKCLKKINPDDELLSSIAISPEKAKNGWLRPTAISLQQEKHWYCHNCGKEGHQNSGCDAPIISYGIILFYHTSDRTIIEENVEIQEWYMNNGYGEETEVDSIDRETGNIDDMIKITHQNEVQYLLILDRHTPDYAQIILGNYELDSLDGIDYLRRLLGRITETEANLILKHNFRDLFMKYWIYVKKDPTKIYHKQFDKANELFSKLIKGISLKDLNVRRNYQQDELITWKTLISETTPHWFDPDWGFPKGRRRRRSTSIDHESDLECAIRELAEETGITPDQYRILDEIEPIQEDIKGSNNLNYRNIYFLAEARSFIQVFINPNNHQQSSEVGKIGWYTYDQATRLIRPYHVARLHILHRIHKYLNSLCPYLNT